LNYSTFHSEFPTFSPLNHNGSHAGDQALAHLCERIFVFVKRRLYTAIISNYIFTATDLLAGGLIPRVIVPNA
jgi:hypothetical protein